MRIQQPGPEEQYSYQKRKKDIYHGRRFMVVINRVMLWFKLVSMEKKNGDFAILVRIDICFKQIKFLFYSRSYFNAWLSYSRYVLSAMIRTFVNKIN